MNVKLLIALLLMWFCASYSTLATAQIIEEQALTFGRIVVVNNDNVGTYTITRFSQTITTSEFGIFEFGQIGIFRLSGISQFGNTSITVEAVNGNMRPPELGFEVFDFSINDYDALVTGDENNEAVIRVGGTLQTSGSGIVSYSPSQYSTQIRITINS